MTNNSPTQAEMQKLLDEVESCFLKQWPRTGKSEFEKLRTYLRTLEGEHRKMREFIIECAADSKDLGIGLKAHSVLSSLTIQ